MQLYAPRSLKEKTGWRSSRFSSTLEPTRSDSRDASSRGVFTAMSYTLLESPQTERRSVSPQVQSCSMKWFTTGWC
jgi:hypothetical protein